MSPKQPPLDSSQPSGLISSANVQTRILSWNDLIKDELRIWLSSKAKADFEEARVRDHQLRADQAQARNKELAKAMADLTTIHQDDCTRIQGISGNNLEDIPIQIAQLLELRDMVQKQANMLAYQQGEYKMWTELIHDINVAYEKMDDEQKLQAQ